MANLKRNTLVELESESNGKKDFELAHAENILNATNNTGKGAWALPKGSKYSFADGKLNSTATA